MTEHGEQHARMISGVLLVVATASLWIFGAALAGVDGHLADAVPSLATVAFAVLAAIVRVRRPANRLGYVFAAIAISLTVLGSGQAYANHALDANWPAGRFVAWLADAAALPTVGLLAGYLVQLFPTGRPISRAWRWPLYAVGAYTVVGTIGNAFASQDLESVAHLHNPYAVASLKPLWSGLINASAVFGGVALIGSVASVIVRWRRADRDERQQLKWFLAAVAPVPVPLLLHDVAPQFTDAVISVVIALIPIAIGVAILRYRLYDLDLVVSRALGYAVVSAAVAGLYLATVAVIEAATGDSVGTPGHVAAAVVAAALFHPLRLLLQESVDRIFYGERNRPYEAVSGLSRQLEGALDPTTVLPTVVETVASALRLPYVGIELLDGGEWAMAAERGSSGSAPVAYPMTYQGEVVGRMLVAPRAGEDVLGEADDRLLTDLARQAGLAAHAVRATTALQRSRAELVTAREEERRRLRRDLHDGLGPALAGVTLGLHAARANVSSSPDEAERLLASIAGQVEEVVADVRRLVYGLRPPALDEFGLVRALQLHASRIEQDDGGVSVEISSPPGGLGRLPAAVEVAAYRIVTEALTNVTRHAAASRCCIELARDAALEVSISDDGRGLGGNGRAGVGITAMRERAAELGGWLSIEELSPGTRVRARLPVGDAG